MKKAFIRTIIVLIVLSLMTAGQALAQEVVEEENQQVQETQANEGANVQREAEIVADAAKRKAEIAAEAAERKAEIAVKVAERQAMVARKQKEAAEKRMNIVKDQMEGGYDEMYDEMLVDLRIPKFTLPRFLHDGSGGVVLVIPSAQMKMENLAVITEDMSIMSRIFDKQVSQSNEPTARGGLYDDFNPFFGRGNRTTEAIYLEGYGALFLMRVNMLFSAPPEAQQKEKTEEETDPVWSQMRREMYAPQEVERRRRTEKPEKKYDAGKVESLKTNLIKTLKHATNIRTLKSDQLVILTVIGDRHRSAPNVTPSYSYGRSSASRYSYGRGTGRRRVVQTLPEVEADSIVPTVLTICAKKSDIDAFAKGELDYDRFRQRIEIFKSYAKAGQQTSPGMEVHKVAHEVLPKY